MNFQDYYYYYFFVFQAYLTEKEFEERFEMTKPKFYALPKWKQNKLKMSLRLF